MNGKVVLFVVLLSSVNLTSVSSIQLEADFHCSEQLAIEYSGTYSHSVQWGDSIDVEPTSFTPPKVFYTDANEGTFYTLIMADPDASRPYKLHWLVTNILGGSLDVQSNRMRGDTEMAYLKPFPPAGSGNHRYFFYLFKQSGDLKDVYVSSEREGFDVAEFAMVNNLELEAINMFQIQQDP